MKSKFFRILGVVTVVAMLVGTLAAPALATVTLVSLSVTPTTISALATYTVQYTSSVDLTGGTGKITVTMPAGATNLGSIVIAYVMLSGTSGIGSDAFINVAPAAVSNTTGTQDLVITIPAAITLQGKIGSAARVQIVIANVRNPAALGDYSVSVKTNATGETTAVASNTFTTTAPVITTLPGIVSLYNPSKILMFQNNIPGSIEAAVALVTGKDFTIELGPGLYQENDILIPAVAENLTIKATGAKADTVVPAAFTVWAPGVKFTGLTLKPYIAGGTAVYITYDGVTEFGNKVTVDGCDFARFGLSTATDTQYFIIYENLLATGTGTISNCTFDSTYGAGADYVIINISDDDAVLNISKNKFLLDVMGAPTYASDVAIHNDAGNANITENTFTGYLGFGKAIEVFADWEEYIFISKNTFTGLKQVLRYDGWSYCDFTNNTVDACGMYSATSPLLNDYPFVMEVTYGTAIVQNKITNSKYYIAKLAATGNSVDWYTVFKFNEFTGNAYGIDNQQKWYDVNASNNWWGAATGPAAGANSTYVDADPWLGAVTTNGTVYFNENVLPAKATVGVDIGTFLWDGSPEDVDIMGAANYAANPGAAAPPSTLKVTKYYDVFIWDDADYARIKFYGSVTDFSEVWFYNAETLSWEKCSDQLLVKAGGYVSVDISYGTAPDWYLVRGTPFVLVEAPPAAPGAEATKQSPVLGAVNVPIDTTFTWPSVPGAVSYTFEIAEETGQTDKFYLKDEVGSSTVGAYKLVDNLKYDTQYWWRVQAINAQNVKSAWTTSFFTTEKEPVEEPEPLPPVIVEENPPAQITLEIPPDTVEKIEPIPAYLLWAVIAVGAILVIVVIVLIVRTRRIS